MDQTRDNLLQLIVIRSAEVLNIRIDDSLLNEVMQTFFAQLAEKNKLMLALADEVFLSFELATGAIQINLCGNNLPLHIKPTWQTVMQILYKDNELRFGEDVDENRPLTINPEEIIKLYNEEAEEGEGKDRDDRQPRQAMSENCPKCGKYIPGSELERCPYCRTRLWTCPRCEQYINTDPEEIDDCPSCKRSMHHIECPECGGDVWIDSNKCGGCNETFEMGKCPECEKPLVLTENIDECPYIDCKSSIWTCPRCEQYINSDPDEVDECPSCHLSMHHVECQECGEEIWVDTHKCESCGETFEMSKCPDCEKPLVQADIEECPYCQSSLWICPSCGQYIDTDPEDAEEDSTCPHCHKSLVTFTCPECGADNSITTEQCRRCSHKFTTDKCPECEREIPAELEECPYCNEYITSTTCPHCGKPHYTAAE